jgi:predicted HAD superfamily Cof-like phosphohydrolase
MNCNICNDTGFIPRLSDCPSCNPTKARSLYDDVVAFHDKFDLPRPVTTAPSIPSLDVIEFRMKFMAEELLEWRDAVARKDLVKAADALADLVYVALGTAAFQGLPFDQIWDAVQVANMAKVRTPSAKESKRGSKFDVIKPAGWVAPEAQIARVINDLLARRKPLSYENRRACGHVELYEQDREAYVADRFSTPVCNHCGLPTMLMDGRKST